MMMSALDDDDDNDGRMKADTGRQVRSTDG